MANKHTQDQESISNSKKNKVSLDNFTPTFKVLKDVLEKGKETMNTNFTKKLLSHFSVKEHDEQKPDFF